jgi:hypothetical protein
MAALTIGGQDYPLELRAPAVVDAEERLVKRGGRPLLEILATPTNGDEPRRGVFFTLAELEAFCWGAWHRKLGEDRPRELLEQFYREGGTLWELHDVVVNALIDGGLLGRRAPPTDPPAAGAAVASGTSSPS